jgi:tetrahydromethanopterin S-methyltransferase subunit F
MAYRIFWTPIAVQDLRDICDFISRDNPVAAQRMGALVLGLVISFLVIDVLTRRTIRASRRAA